MSDRDAKRLILDAALSIFVEHGFEQATVKQICTRSGISNGTLFHHFASKDAIAAALYLEGIASYQAGLLHALEPYQAARAARAMVRAAVHHHLAWVESHRDLAWFMYERGRPDWQPAHGAAVRKLNRSIALHVRDWMAPLAAAGVLRDLPLPVLAACVIGPAHFIARRWVSGMITARPTSFAEALADAAWAALAPRRSRRLPDAPAPRPSPAALIETAALAAACTACPPTSEADWMLAQMAMNTTSGEAPVPIATQVESVRIEADGHVVLVDVLVAEGRTTWRGHAVCLRSAIGDAA
jgi:AcrR family transcriptional regulator